MRMTGQKKLIADEMHKLNFFFTAYALHDKTVRKNKRIGLATVYRFLKNAEKNGELHSFICDGKKIYSTDKTSHTHFTCEKCGLVKHISIDTADFLKKIIQDDVCHFQIELSGICEKCK
ncbi:MAG TPA: transcriptional repressor [Candidatus Nanoarchaeia archaeon]|nr:transcriptional repressor [Candidatus Nanoarchaeia archaeon]